MIDVSEKRLRIVIFSGLFLVSLFLNTMPPLLLEFQRVFSLSMSQSGIIPAVHSGGTILANIIALYFIAKYGTRNSIYISISTSLIGLICISLSSSLFYLSTGIMFLAFSFGMAMSGYSTLFSHLPETIRDFSRFHAFFGLGGLLAPILVKVVLYESLSYRLLYAGYVVILASYCILIKRSNIPQFKSDSFRIKQLIPLFTNPGKLLLIFISAYYATSEMAVVVWGGNFFSEIHSITLSNCALLISCFWAFFTLARFTGGKLAEKISLDNIPPLMSLLSILAITGFTFLPKIFSILCFALTGFFFATIFPAIHQKLNSETEEKDRGPLNAMLFLSVSMMGAFMIPLLGVVGELNIKGAMLCTLLPFFLIIWVYRKSVTFGKTKKPASL